MSLVPDQLHLKNLNNETINLYIRGGGEQQLEASGSLRVQCDNSLIMNAYDVIAQTKGGNFGIANSTLTNIYRLPNPNNQQPQQGQVIEFNADGTSQFATIGGGGGGNFSTPSNQNLDMNIHTINNTTDLNLVSPDSVGPIASLNVRDNQTTLSTNKPLSVSCAGQDMELEGNNIRCRIGDGIFAVFNNSPLGYYVFPSQASPSVDNSYIKFGANGFSTFEPFPTIPSPPSGSAFMFNPANADLNMTNYSITDATDVSTLNYSLETVGTQSDQNATDIATLQSQVASLITIINNLTGIQV